MFATRCGTHAFESRCRHRHPPHIPDPISKAQNSIRSNNHSHTHTHKSFLFPLRSAHTRPPVCKYLLLRLSQPIRLPVWHEIRAFLHRFHSQLFYLSHTHTRTHTPSTLSLPSTLLVKYCLFDIFTELFFCPAFSNHQKWSLNEGYVFFLTIQDIVILSTTYLVHKVMLELVVTRSYVRKLSWDLRQHLCKQLLGRAWVLLVLIRQVLYLFCFPLCLKLRRWDSEPTFLSFKQNEVLSRIRIIQRVWMVPL